ncbi:MAG: flagellar hook-basal body protein [Thermomicrobiales bacterium]
MIRGWYTAASGMVAQMARQLSNAANLANLSTPGYRQVDVQVEEFQNMLLTHFESQDEFTLGDLSTAVAMAPLEINPAQGSLRETGRALDLAISGNGFFSIQAAGGNEYTRNGVFNLEPGGRLVTSDGFQVNGVGDTPIIIPPERMDEVWITSDGTVQAGDDVFGQLQIVEFAEPGQIESNGRNRYITDQEPLASPDSSIHQGYLEMSNVDVNQTTVDLMEAQRAYEFSQRMVQMQDETLQMTVRDLGRV